ncbi:MAG: TIGR00341 family protein [Planctomycetota bacterium]
MKYVEIIAEDSSTPMLRKVAEKHHAVDLHQWPAGEDGMRVSRLLVQNDQLQGTLDTLQNLLGAQATARVIVMAVETTVPQPPEQKRIEEESATATREALLQAVEPQSRFDRDAMILTVLSTIVATIGLLEASSAVIIGAMVIAPLLGPNLALSLGTALGESGLIRRSARSLVLGVGLAVLLSLVVGLIWPGDFDGNQEMLSRTQAGPSAVILALASGAAAALSLTTGLSSVLVGVMVAVALLPPAATVGLYLSRMDAGAATGAALLLGVNIACINLASKLVFVLKGVHPRRGVDKDRARTVLRIYIVGWIGLLVLLLLAIFLRKPLQG